MVEFALGFLVFIVMAMGVLDFGLGIYEYNGVSQAAREIARAASVHQGSLTFGVSPQINAVVATQQHLVPGLGSPAFACTDVNGATEALAGGHCPNNAYVTVTVSADYRPVTPLLAFLGSFTVEGTSSAQIQQ
jgi:Flp pilus assembly protein TadG